MMPTRLLPLPPVSLVQGLADLPAALNVAHPLKRKHEAALPSEIARLSEWLTYERDDLPRDYLSRPATLSAYLRYFLPWNVYRQGRLLAGLGLPLPDDACVVDVGAGPLTFALAMWFAMPELRNRRLRYLAVDRAQSVLQVGHKLMRAVAPDAPWQVELRARPAGAQAMPAADLLVLANVLNEIRRPSNSRDDESGDANDILLGRWQGALTPTGRVLIVEPGTRSAARELSALRGRAIEAGWRLLAPCPHEAECPHPGTGHRSWCHFGFIPYGVPDWLAHLSRSAKLPKDRASLSFLLLEPPREDASERTEPDGRDVRVISDPFPLNTGGRGRYGCAACGMVLLEEKVIGSGSGPQAGDLVRVEWPDRPRRDVKSGATVVPLPGTGGGGTAPARRPFHP